MSATKEKKANACKKVYVESRYKQAAENVSHQASRSKEKSNVSQNSKDGSRCSQDTSSSRSGSSRGMTSTPASKGELLLPALDQSAVPNVSAAPTFKGRIGYSPSSSVKKNLAQKMKSVKTTKLHAPVVATHKKKGDHYDQKLADLEVDLLYTQYLQMVYIESKAKKALKFRSNHSMEKLLKLCNLISQYMHKFKSKEFTLQLMSISIKVYNHLHKQENVLKPVYEVIPTLTEKYKNLAGIVNENKHKLHVKDILLPDPESEGDIADALRHILISIAEFFTSVPNFKEIIKKVDSYENYVETGTDIFTALERGFDLLLEARDLFFTEASFLISFESGEI